MAEQPEQYCAYDLVQPPLPPAPSENTKHLFPLEVTQNRFEFIREFAYSKAAWFSTLKTFLFKVVPNITSFFVWNRDRREINIQL